MAVATLGPYRVTGVIGRGGMGTVYAAEHTLLGRPAAIKVLLPELSQKQEIVMRFFNEARAAAGIRHPSIVEVYDFGWTPDGAAYLVMERLDGETLARRLGRGRLAWQNALVIARQIAGALAAAHAKSIVHRDLKPENIFLVPDPEVPGGERIKLLDFGIAKLAGEIPAGVQVTRTGAVIGTPTYMAPEQCRGVAVDHRADLYALGCVLFELCSGRPPFVGEGSGDVLAAHIHVPAPTLASVDVRAPAELEQLIARLLAKLPAQRTQTADDLVRAIDAIAAERGAGRSSTPAHAARAAARPPTGSPAVTTLSGAAATSPPATPRPGGARVRHGRRVAIIAATAASITAVVTAIVMLRGGAASPPAGPVAARPAELSAPTPSPSSPPSAPGPSPPTPRPPAQSASPSTPTPSTQSAPPSAPTTSTPATSSPAPTPSASVSSSATTAAPSSPASDSPRSQTSGSSRPKESTSVASRSTADAPAPRHASSSAPARTASSEETVSVEVESVPAGAQVSLGGTPLGKTPVRATVRRRAGDVALVARLAGYADRTVMVRGDKAIHEHVKLSPATPARPRPNRDQSVNPFAE